MLNTKVRKSIWQSFETAYLRTFCNTLKTENPVFIGIRFFKKVRKSFEAYRIRVSVGRAVVLSCMVLRFIKVKKCRLIIIIEPSDDTHISGKA